MVFGTSQIFEKVSGKAAAFGDQPEGNPLNIIKGGIFDAGFGEILRSPHLQWAGKCKFAP